MNDPVTDRQIRGSCHCENIRFTLVWPDLGPNIPVRACGCSFCTKHRAAWTSHPSGRFDLQIADESQVKRYQFGTKTADFLICTTCGVASIVTCIIEGTRYAVFNVNTFDKVDRSQLVETVTNFEGETTENRLARRQRNWTPESNNRDQPRVGNTKPTLADGRRADDGGGYRARTISSFCWKSGAEAAKSPTPLASAPIARHRDEQRRKLVDNASRGAERGGSSTVNGNGDRMAGRCKR